VKSVERSRRLFKKRAGALVVGGDALFFRKRFQLAELAARSALPAIYASREYADAWWAGELWRALLRWLASCRELCGRILKGEKPSDLPVQQVSKTELVINLRTSKALGITMPSSLLPRADEVIE
jgi:putative ABC transport system substrate-binding protein